MNSEQIQKLAITYSSHTGLKASTLGVYAVNDGKFFVRLSGGYDCRTKTARKVAEWFSAKWPEDLAWPSDIPRPSTKKEDAA